MASLFGKKNNTTIAELEDYYTKENQSNSARSWVLAFLSLVITVAVIVGLFFAGQWLYDELFNSDSNEDTSTGQAEEGAGDEEGATSADGSETSGEESATSGETDGSASGSEDSADGAQQGVVSEEAATVTVNEDGSTTSTGTDDGSSTTSSTSGEVAATTDSDDTETGKEVPDTGPGETAIALIVGSGILGYFISRKRQLAKQEN